jgi:hypothetical protein
VLTRGEAQLIVWGVGFGLVTLDRLIVLAIETLRVRGS